ncbi:MAG TPA: hypothetical protein DDY59_04215 [Lachnospiraceae bacterium]|nr:hypothetical protein [Lachnospiraceae bacterium]HCR41549.1 hypothetical protein [Lachnospiraceae bacterium]
MPTGKVVVSLSIPILLLTIIFALWLRYEIIKSNRQDKLRNQSFWHKEKQANSVRRRDISDLDYITVELDRLPLKDHEDDTINSYRDTILALSGRKIVNFTGLTNTELKLQYGTANIDLLAEYDSNYTKLVSILHKWGERLYNRGNVSDATAVLEYAVSCHTDAVKTYRLLAAIYKEQNTPDKINHLIAMIPNTKMLRKDTLIRELNQLKDS